MRGAANQLAEAQRFDPSGFDGDDPIGMLHAAFDEQEGLLGDDQSPSFEEERRDNGIGDACFIFKTDEDKAIGCARSLPANHIACHADELPIARPWKIRRSPDVTELRANQRHRMRPSG